jgi:nascent polypeptide-associated complex subunit alpha
MLPQHSKITRILNFDVLDEPKLNRGEKKCRKALIKIGMKPFNGVTRVTLRKRDGMIFVVNEPEVLRVDGDGKSFAVFGELKLEDPNARMQQAEAKKFAEGQMAAAQAQAAAKASAPQTASKASDEAPLSEEGITAGHIDMVMDHTSCSRNDAIKALRETNNDMINAVMKLTN